MLAFPSKVHVSAQRTLTFTLTNPTQADATWQIVDGAYGEGAPPDPPEDAQGGFSVEPRGGRVEGRGIKQPRTQVITVRFAPGEPRQYSKRLVFEVEKGRGTAVQLSGEGTLDERYESS